MYQYPKKKVFNRIFIHAYIFLTNNEAMQAYAEKKPCGNPITCTLGLFAHSWDADHTLVTWAQVDLNVYGSLCLHDLPQGGEKKKKHTAQHMVSAWEYSFIFIDQHQPDGWQDAMDSGQVLSEKLAANSDLTRLKIASGEWKEAAIIWEKEKKKKDRLVCVG